MTPPDRGDPSVPPEPGPSGNEGEHSRSGTSEPHFSDASRRTYLAAERTLLAWWRTALGTMGVAVAIGSIIPKLTDLPEGPLVALGGGYAALSLCFVLIGLYRHLAGEAALARRGYFGLSKGTVIALAGYMTALLVATACVMFWGPD